MKPPKKKSRSDSLDHEHLFFKVLDQALFDKDVNPISEETLISVVTVDEVLRRRMSTLLVGDRNMRAHLPRLWDKLVEMTPPEQLSLS